MIYEKENEDDEDVLEKEWQKIALTWLQNDPRVGFCTQSDSDRTRNRKFRNGKAGLPDVIGFCSDGRALFIELKSSTGKVTSEQETFILRAEGFKVRAGVARSVDDLERILSIP